MIEYENTIDDPEEIKRDNSKMACNYASTILNLIMRIEKLENDMKLILGG